ncbi:ABC transporter ATP-binding protein [Cryobacterium sp. Y50]|uniref:ABC transporter ATP-binding protein n=1 Tax=Cryobacterium sp. Y50 TaxID=2048286 RepID=UPI000CE54191|nr:ABC transporter ATP-binding protein [Cryobacterium sp. Y50]
MSSLTATAVDVRYKITNVSHTFPGMEVQALKDINLSITSGSFSSLIGPSGCGKSTLLNTMAGLLSPSQGQVTLDDQNVTEPPDEVGIMFQKATLLPWRTAIDNVLLPIELRDGAKAAATFSDKAANLLDTVGLAGFHEAYPRELSGGMAQRVAICRMLITEPEILLLDEPFGALDELTRERMDLELQRIAAGRTATVVLVTHSIPEAVLLSDRVFAMSARPGSISDVIDIDLPRPRSMETLNHPAFGAYVSQVRDALNRGHDYV